jgi:hypothetical protein
MDCGVDFSLLTAINYQNRNARPGKFHTGETALSQTAGQWLQ